MSILTRCWLYLNERFPLKDFIPLSAVFAAASSFTVQVYMDHDLQRPDALFTGFVALFLFLFRLRLFDEFKDFKHDAQYYPDRPVQRGLITLQELAVLLVIVSGIEFFIAFMNGFVVTIIFLIAFFYSLLMFKEFFVSSWLRKHFTVYIASHEILVFPVFFYIFALNGMRLEHLEQTYFWFLVILLGGQMFLLEVARKIRPKELEVDSGDTYTAQYGIRGASILLVFLGAMVAGFNFYIVKIIYGKVSIFQILPLLMGLFFLYSVMRFLRWPSAKSAKGAFHIAIFFVFLIDIVLVAQFFIR